MGAFHVGTGFFFGEAEVVARVVIRDADQGVEMDGIDGKDVQRDVPFLE